ncbi:MAG: hypothetical protein E6K54_06945 [Gammaproteobacteria bacterium]|nr:MAG: hypothetical protein E6K54_06945 [Gammaproteobacteria bacterium]
MADRNPIQAGKIDQSLPLQSCVPVSLVNTDQESSQGVSCEIPNGKISFFHSKPYGDSPPTPISEQREINFENCRSIEWEGRSAVVCEGKEKTAIITPQLPQRFFDGVDNWLMLGQIALVMGKNIFTKFFPKSVTDTRYQLIHKLSDEQVALWNNKLAEISIQLQGMQGVGDEKQRYWIQYQLEDRQEELKRFLQSDRITDYEKSRFQENLLAFTRNAG